MNGEELSQAKKELAIEMEQWRKGTTHQAVEKQRTSLPSVGGKIFRQIPITELIGRKASSSSTVNNEATAISTAPAEPRRSFPSKDGPCATQ